MVQARAQLVIKESTTFLAQHRELRCKREFTSSLEPPAEIPLWLGAYSGGDIFSGVSPMTFHSVPRRKRGKRACTKMDIIVPSIRLNREI